MNITKFFTLAAAGVFFTATVQGESFSGATAGLQMGVNSAKIKQDTTSSVGVTSSEVSGTNLAVLATAGWGEVVRSMFYLGVETRLTLTGGTTKTTVGPTKGSVISNKPGPSFLAGGRFGVLFTERAMGFVGLAGGLGEMTYTVQDAGGLYTNKKRDLLVSPYIGTEIALSESLNARFDLSYVVGKKRNFTPVQLAGAGITSTSAVTFKPTWINCSVGVSYRF